MKIKLFVATILLFFMHSATAELMIWRGSVTFSDGANTIEENFSGPTYTACEAQRASRKSMHFLPFSVISETICYSNFSVGSDNLIVNEPIGYEPPKPGPLCTSCPYFNTKLFELVYPGESERFIRLMDDYRIQEYNEALKDLNSQYDLDGFSRKMHALEKEIVK